MRFQLLLFAALLGVAAALWLNREIVSDAFAKLSGSAAQTQSKKGRDGHNEGVPVIVAHVGQASNSDTISAVGTARAQRSIIVQPETDGVVVELNVRAGSRVSKGDLIARLDDRQAQLAVQIAQRKLEEASRQLGRSELLEKRSVNSNAKVQDAKNLEDRARLELFQAQESLADLTITAPFDGVVGIPKVEVGERVTAATPLISLDQRDEIIVEYEVAEQFLARIAPGDEIAGTTPSHAGASFSGRIEYIDSRIDAASRTVMVRAVIPNGRDELRPGMSFVVDQALPGNEFAAVPELALQWRKGESYVWIVRNDAAEKVLVRTIKRLNSTILVDGDLRPGELVVVEGVQRLRQGRKVQYAAPDRGSSPATGSGQSIAPAALQKG